MKIIHLMRQQKFTAGIALFYDKFFNNGEHEICYISIYGEGSQINKDLTIPQSEVFISDLATNNKKEIKKVLSVLREKDYVVIHSLYWKGRIIRKFALDKKLRNKIVWIEWGFDLYDWKINIKTLRNRIDRYCGRILRTKCNSVIAIFPPDVDFYNKRFPDATAKVYYAPYCGSDVSITMKKGYVEKSRIKEKLEKGQTIYIQIGNRAYRKLNHIKTLELLERFKDENIKIVIPLSYGRQNYAMDVQKKAEESFPGKTICLTEFLPFKEYVELLSNVDIVIYNTSRQIALGNIYEAIMNSTKLYLNEEGSMYGFFKANGVPVQKTEDLETCTVEELFKDYPVKDRKSFDNYIDFLSSIERQTECWRKVYDDLRQRV